MSWITEDQRAKLPRYVRSYIERLEDENRALAKRLDLAQPSGITNTEEATVLVGMDGWQKRELDDTRVRFQFGGTFTRYIDVFRGDVNGSLEIRAGRTIAICPSAANSCRVWIEEGGDLP
jgi:hypothetical protein